MITPFFQNIEPNIFTWTFIVHFMKLLNNDIQINKDNRYDLAHENRVFYLNGKLHVLIHEKYVRNTISNSRISNLSRFNNFYYFTVEESEYYDYISDNFSNEFLLTMNDDDAYKLKSPNGFVENMIKMYSRHETNNSYYSSNCLSKFEGDYVKQEYGRYYYQIDKSDRFIRKFSSIPQRSTLYDLIFKIK